MKHDPDDAKREGILHYRQLIEDFENQVKDFDEKLSGPNQSGTKKQGWKMLREISKNELSKCREELNKLLGGK